MSDAGVTPLSEKLLQSQIVRDFERAFAEATGLPLKFVLAGKKRPGMRSSINANAFCFQMAGNKPGCQMCVEMQECLNTDDPETKSAACMAGLTDSAVPVRVAKAKKLLANPQLRVSEIAFEVGFSSLTHFNRMFQRIAGRSPSSYRGQLCGTLAES